jgi:hypothetical protein
MPTDDRPDDEPPIAALGLPPDLERIMTRQGVTTVEGVGQEVRGFSPENFCGYFSCSPDDRNAIAAAYDFFKAGHPGPAPSRGGPDRGPGEEGGGEEDEYQARRGG